MSFVNRLKADMQDKADIPLIDNVGECSLSLINMVIFGVATPYLHNGDLSVEDDNGEVSLLISVISCFFASVYRFLLYLSSIMLKVFVTFCIGVVLIGRLRTMC